MNESDISILNLSAPPGGAGEVELVAEGGGQPEVVDVAEGEVVRPGHRLVQRALLTLLKAEGESGRNKEIGEKKERFAKTKFEPQTTRLPSRCEDHQTIATS